MTFHDVGCLTTEDRKAIVEVISNIKKEEKEAMDRATSVSRTPPTPPRPFPKTHKYSSLSNKFKTPFRAPTSRR